jgi:sorbitol-specific phosphotransferase system component IIC
MKILRKTCANALDDVFLLPFTLIFFLGNNVTLTLGIRKENLWPSYLPFDQGKAIDTAGKSPER